MRSFGHQRAVRDEVTGDICGSKDSPVKARTLEALGGAFGSDGNHRLVVSLEREDLIVLRPEKTSRKVSIAAKDLYAQLIRQEANAEMRRRGASKREKKALRLAALRRMRRCYANAASLVLNRNDLFYCEGLAVTEKVRIPLFHAWACTADGSVVDPTWRDGLAYFGVAFKRRYLIQSLSLTGYYGVMDNWQYNWPVLRTPVEKWKAL